MVKNYEMEKILSSDNAYTSKLQLRRYPLTIQPVAQAALWLLRRCRRGNTPITQVMVLVDGPLLRWHLVRLSDTGKVKSGLLQQLQQKLAKVLI